MRTSLPEKQASKPNDLASPFIAVAPAQTTKMHTLIDKYDLTSDTTDGEARSLYGSFEVVPGSGATAAM